MRPQPEQLEQLTEHITDRLQRHREGLSEHRLLCELRQAGAPYMVRVSPQDTLGLFRQHFVLMHALYRLQARLQAEGGPHLAIDPLCIRLDPARPAARGHRAVGEADPLKAYYLDLSQLEDTDQDQVSDLLDDFWQRYARRGRRGEALAVLGLTDPVDARDIKRRYRQLAMQHHPDRGGDTAQLQRLHEAMRLLQNGP